MRVMRFFTEFIFRYRKMIIAMVGLITLFFGWQMTNLKIDSDILKSLPKTDKAAELFNRIGDVFGGNSQAVIVMQSDDVFSPNTLKSIAVLTEKIKSIDGVEAVTSLTDVMDIKEGADGSLEVGKLIDSENIPKTKEEVEAVKQYALSKEMYVGSLISKDAKNTVIACLISSESDSKEVTLKIKKAALEAKLPEKLNFGGIPFMISDLAGLIFKDLKTLVPIVALLIIVTLYLSFRTIRGVVIPLTSVLISNIWMFGFMSLLGKPITLISDVIPVLLIAIGTAPSIHILSKYDEDTSLYGSTGEKTKEAFTEVGWRVILTSLTIVVGFTSFIFGSYLDIIRDFGIFTSVGVIFMLLISVMFVPAVLSFVKVKEKKHVKKEGYWTGYTERAMDVFGKFIFNNEILIIAGSAAVLIASLFFVSKIDRKVDFVEFFPAKHEARITNDIMKNNFGGTGQVQVIVSGDIQNPFVLKEMQRLEKYMDYQPNLSNPQSIALMIAEMNGIMDKGKLIPDSREKVANLWFFIDGQPIVSQMVDSGLETGLIQVMMRDMKSELMNKNLASIEEYLKDMAKELKIIDSKALKGADKETVAGYRAKRAAEAIVWDAGKRDEAAAVDKDAVARILVSQLMKGKIDIDKACAEIEPLIPAVLKQNTNFIKDIKNDIAELKQENIALSKTVYENLSEDKPAAEDVNFTVDYTGIPLMLKHMDESLIKSQVESFLFALVFIYILLVVQLRSFVGAFFGLSPILMVVALMFGFMGVTGIPLDIATVLVASIALGIGIDYAIHFSVRFRNNYRAIPDHLKALDATLNTTGRAIIKNVFAVTMGFLTLMFASLVPMTRFGMLVSVAMIVSGIGSLTLLPALSLITKGKFIGK